MTYQLIIQPQAEHDLDAHMQAGNKQLLKKVFALFEELTQHPKTGTGKPKPLKHQQAGFWSRRIDDRHRLLYKIDEDIITVFVIAAWGHYDDK
jgi:toxin YoeB